VQSKGVHLTAGDVGALAVTVQQARRIGGVLRAVAAACPSFAHSCTACRLRVLASFGVRKVFASWLARWVSLNRGLRTARRDAQANCQSTDCRLQVRVDRRPKASGL